MPKGIVLFITIIFTAFIARLAMVLCHEWAHSFMGWCFGFKAHPFDIFYGDWTLLQAREDIDYEPIFHSSSPWQASLIGIAALVMNTLLLLLSRKGLRRAASQQRPFLTQALFWFAVLNLAELYSYMPLRAFAPGGDVDHFVTGLGIPHWLGFVVGTPLVSWQLFILLTKDLPTTYQALDLKREGPIIGFITLTVSIIFGVYGCAPLFYYGLWAPQTRWSLVSAVVGILVLFFLTRNLLTKRSTANNSFI